MDLQPRRGTWHARSWCSTTGITQHYEICGRTSSACIRWLGKGVMEMRNGKSVLIIQALLLIYICIFYMPQRPIPSDIHDVYRLETIEVCIVVIKPRVIEHLQPLLTSMLYFHKKIRPVGRECQLARLYGPCAIPVTNKSSTIHLHFLTDNVTQPDLILALNGRLFQHFRISIYSVEPYLDQITWMKSAHRAGWPPMLKLMAEEILPKALEKIIMIDADTLFNEDIRYLWNHFNEFGATQLIGAVWDQYSSNYQNWSVISDALTLENSENCIRSLECPKDLSKYFPAGGINGGVTLLHLKNMRKLNWHKMWTRKAKELMRETGRIRGGEQGLINAVLSENIKFYHKLPCVWNVQLWNWVGARYCRVVWPDWQAEVDECLNQSSSGIHSVVPAIVHYSAPGKPSAKDPAPKRSSVLSRTRGFLSNSELRRRFFESFNWFGKLPDICLH